jgi:hypothetical protein
MALFRDDILLGFFSLSKTGRKKMVRNMDDIIIHETPFLCITCCNYSPEIVLKKIIAYFRR